MRKILIGSTVAVAGMAAVALGGWKYANDRVRAEVEANFAALRAAGATATHGPVDFDLWTRNLLIADVNIKSAGTAPTEVTIGKLALGALDLWATDLVAKSLDLTDLAVKGAFGKEGEFQVGTRSPRVAANNVRVAKVPVDLADAKTSLQKWAAQVAAVTAASITAPELTLSLVMPPLPQPTSLRGPTPANKSFNVDYVYSNVKLDDVRAELKPEQKVAAIRELTEQGKKVVMIGDGVNDAPSLAVAHIGVAMGARGADAALEQADVVLMNDRLENFLAAFRLSCRARRIIRQNLFISLGTVVVLVSFALVGKIPLTLGVVGHEGSTVIVVLNSLRLLFGGGNKK